MGKVLFGVLIAGISAVIFLYPCCKKSATPLVLPEDQWWGPGAPVKEDTSIRPFKINVPDQVIEDLNHRLDTTRRMTPPLEGVNFEYGFNTDTLQKLLLVWRNEYKWRQRETFLNQFPQYKTKIQGLDIHFIHVKPKLPAGVKRTIPLLILHGWPGSVREFYSLIPLLTQKPLHGADFVFEVIAPSLPGYGFSDAAAKPGLGPAQIAVVFKNLMSRIGHDKFYIQGGDWGSQVASHMGVLYPNKVLGLHLNMCADYSFLTMLKIALGSFFPSLIAEKEYHSRLYPFWAKFQDKLLETGYMHIQASKPDTIGVGLTDSPAGLAAYILEKFSTGTNKNYRQKEGGGLTEKFTYTDLLDNVMIYWITGTITPSMRIYAEHFAKEHRTLDLNRVPVPTWCSQFPNEIQWLPDWLIRSRYPKLQGSVQHNSGGHFAAFELPSVLAEDVWKAIIQMDNEANKPNQEL